MPFTGVNGEVLMALVPPLCAHRHRYDGVLAPNAKLRAAVTALAAAQAEGPAQAWK
jgi:hypothetical protein